MHQHLENNSTNHDFTSTEKRRSARNSTLVSVVVNIFLSVIQIIAGFLCASHSLIADGIHSLSDLLSDFVVLLANHHSHKAADENHNYGHQRFENAASLFLGTSLAVVGIAILWHAAAKIIFGTATQDVQIEALWIALFTIAAKEFLFRYMLAVARKLKSAMLIANAWHARSDAASSLVVAAGILGSLLGYKVFDLIGALIVGLIIAKAGFEFAWRALHELMDHSATKEENEKIIEIVNSVSGVLGCHDLRTRKMGDMISMDIHIEVDGAMSVKESHEIVDFITHKLTSEFHVIDVMIHVDPFGESH